MPPEQRGGLLRATGASKRDQARLLFFNRGGAERTDLGPAVAPPAEEAPTAVQPLVRPADPSLEPAAPPVPTGQPNVLPVLNTTGFAAPAPAAATTGVDAGITGPRETLGGDSDVPPGVGGQDVPSQPGTAANISRVLADVVQFATNPVGFAASKVVGMPTYGDIAYGLLNDYDDDEPSQSGEPTSAAEAAAGADQDADEEDDVGAAGGQGDTSSDDAAAGADADADDEEGIGEDEDEGEDEFHTGRIVPGRGPKRITAEGGEFVVNRRATQRHRGLLNRINRDRRTPRQGGGLLRSRS